jgi:hypothetical protein
VRRDGHLDQRRQIYGGLQPNASPQSATPPALPKLASRRGLAAANVDQKIPAMQEATNMSDDKSNEETDDLDELHNGVQPDDVEYMFAQTARGVTISDGRITLTGVSHSTLFFSDRPYRLTGHIPTDDFISQWGVGDDSFANEPPNALLSLFEDDHVNDVVVVLTDPVSSNGDLSYAVEVTDGELAPSTGPASLFIDMIGRPMTPMSVGGVRRRGRRRGRRRMRRRLR